jgi:ubiquinone/menaquinone biosynthesis C-methylase UbiE
MSTKNEIVEYYNSGVESNRLSLGPFKLEFERTKEIILRHIKKPSKILDIGGGMGAYSFWLSDMGHEVNLLDLSPVNIESAKKHLKESGKQLQSLNIGNACDLKFKSESFDIALMLGPMYHLTKKEERLQALSEAKRVLIPGGLLFCVGISRYASTYDGFFSNLIQDSQFIDIMNQDLKDGQHINNTGKSKYFTTSYFHLPEELKTEINEAGLRVDSLISIESFGWLLPNFEDKWNNESYKKLLLETIRKVEREPSLLGVGPHIMAIAQKV